MRSIKATRLILLFSLWAVALGAALDRPGDPSRAAAASPPSPPLFCPAKQQPPRPAPRVRGFDARPLVGLRLADAEAAARRRGCSLRPASVDGAESVLTADFHGNRIDVVVEAGRVAGLIGIS